MLQISTTVTMRVTKHTYNYNYICFYCYQIVKLAILIYMLLFLSSWQLEFGIEKVGCCIFRPAFGCCAPQKLVEIFIFSKKAEKMRKKQEICSKIYQKTRFFEFATKTLVEGFIPRKNSFFTFSEVKAWIQIQKAIFCIKPKVAEKVGYKFLVISKHKIIN